MGTWFDIGKSPNCFFAEFAPEKLQQAEELILQYGQYGHTEVGEAVGNGLPPQVVFYH